MYDIWVRWWNSLPCKSCLMTLLMAINILVFYIDSEIYLTCFSYYRLTGNYHFWIYHLKLGKKSKYNRVSTTMVPKCVWEREREEERGITKQVTNMRENSNSLLTTFCFKRNQLELLIVSLPFLLLLHKVNFDADFLFCAIIKYIFLSFSIIGFYILFSNGSYSRD